MPTLYKLSSLIHGGYIPTYVVDACDHDEYWTLQTGYPVATALLVGG